MPPEPLRLVAVADLHGHLPAELPDGDVLALIGDLFPVADHSPNRQAAWLERQLAPYLRELPFEAILVVAGNHDFVFAAPQAGWRHLLPDNTHYLEDEAVRVEGLVFHGAPWTPPFGDWAFMLPEPGLTEKWALIPADTDVLLSHGPPHLACDLTRRPPPGHVGSRSLRRWIEQAQPPLVVCGHIHEGNGRARIGNTTIANVSHVDADYRPVHQPQTLHVRRRAGTR